MEKHLLEYFSQAVHYLPAQGTGNRCKNPSKLPSQPQVVVNALFKYLIKNPAQQRGLLIWHTTGSGKTCSAAAVMEAYFYTKKQIVFATSVEALKANPPQAFHACLTRYFPEMKALTFEDFTARVKFFTFAQLSHYLLISRALKNQPDSNRGLLSDAMLIIDEVHNIFHPLPHQKAEHRALYEFLADYNNPYTKSLHLAVLTATPGDTPEEIVRLLNLLRPRTQPPLSPPATPAQYVKFANAIQNLVSYFDISKDLTRFPKVTFAPPSVLPMSMHQYRRYAKAIDELTPMQKNYEALLANDKLDKYMRPARKYANMLYTMEHKLALHEFSSKLPKLLETIKKFPHQKHYIYSAFFENRGFGGHGIRAIAKLLKDELKYQEAQTPPTTPALRYILAVNTTPHLSKLIEAFNAPNNARGDYIQIILASQKYNEGLDLKAVKHVHILEPLLTFNKEIQTIGRGARYCSHQDLHKQQWTLTIHKYIADFPPNIMDHDPQKYQEEITWLENAIAMTKHPEEKQMYKARYRNLIARVKQEAKFNPTNHPMVDKLLPAITKERIKDTLILLQVMRENAVDCKLFESYHGLPCKNNLQVK